MLITASPEIFGVSSKYIGSWSVTGAGCCAAAAGPDAASPGTPSTESKNGHRYCHLNCASHTRSCRRLQCWVDQRTSEQPLPPLRTRPLVRARCEGPVAGRSPTGTLYRRLCDLLPISLGRHPRTGRLASAVGKIRPYSRADQDQIGRVWSVRAETRGQTRQEPPGNYLLS